MLPTMSIATDTSGVCDWDEASDGRPSTRVDGLSNIKSVVSCVDTASEWLSVEIVA